MLAMPRALATWLIAVRKTSGSRSSSAAERWPRTQITETHPKALRWIYPGLRIQHGCPSDIESRDHEWDAVIAAYSAFQFVQRTEGWSDLYESELEKFLPSNYSATYWFPNRLQIKGR